MKSFNLKIADYQIRFESTAGGPELTPAERFLSFISDDNKWDVIIRIHSGIYDIPPGAEKVFGTPYVEEISGVRIKKNDEFWNVYKDNDDLFIKTGFPLSGESKKAVLKFSLTANEWDLWPEQHDNAVDPMEYPLDGLILYYITVIHNDIMIHGSGVNYRGKGYLFTGVSGKGKTTLARLWDSAGAKVIHDDRLIIRRYGDGFRMFNTPVYNNDKPSVSPVDRLFIIEHGPENEMKPVTGSNAVSLLVSNCIQHNWDPGMIRNLLGSVTDLYDNVQVKILYFRPEMNIVDYILENDQQ